MRQDAVSRQARPFGSFEHFRRMLDDLYAFHNAVDRQDGDVWTPPTDVYETNGEIVIKMSLPGVKPGNVHIAFDGDVVTISGFREWPERTHVVALHQMEIRNGYFQRSIVIREPFDPDGMKWKYADGFLWLVLPKAPQRARRMLAFWIQL